MNRPALAVDDRPHAGPILHSEIFGPMDVAPDRCLTFPFGLVGMPDCRRFALLHTERDPFHWLHSVEHAGVAFLTVEPEPIFGEPEVDLGNPRIAPPGGGDPRSRRLLALVTLPEGDGWPTANLRAPVVLDLASRRARQIVLADDDRPMRAPIRVAELREGDGVPIPRAAARG